MLPLRNHQEGTGYGQRLFLGLGEAPEPGRITDVLGSLPVDVPTRCLDVEACDVLLVPGGGGVWPLLQDQALLGWVRRVHATTRFTTSVCIGALLLAAARLFDGLTAATHWGTAREIEGYGAVYAPEQAVRQDRLIASAGHPACRAVGLDHFRYPVPSSRCTWRLPGWPSGRLL